MQELLFSGWALWALRSRTTWTDEIPDFGADHLSAIYLALQQRPEGDGGLQKQK